MYEVKNIRALVTKSPWHNGRCSPLQFHIRCAETMDREKKDIGHMGDMVPKFLYKSSKMICTYIILFSNPNTRGNHFMEKSGVFSAFLPDKV